AGRPQCRRPALLARAALSGPLAAHRAGAALGAVLDLGVVRRTRLRSDQPRVPHRPLAPGRAAVLRPGEAARLGRAARPAPPRRRRARAGAPGPGGRARPPATCVVHCGLHDSNAALHAARGLPELAGGPFAVVSTGTWVVSMAVGGAGPVAYDPAEDMLANVDVDGRPIPTARFMGGRDYESWMGEALGEPGDPALLPRAAAADWPHPPPPLRAARAA